MLETRNRPGGAVMWEEEVEEEAPIFTLETVPSHDLDDDKEAVSPLKTVARILRDDPHASRGRAKILTRGG